MMAVDVPDKLKGCRLIGLDLAALVADASMRGEFEERLKSVLEEVTNSGGKSFYILILWSKLKVLKGAWIESVGDFNWTKMQVFSPDQEDSVVLGSSITMLPLHSYSFWRYVHIRRTSYIGQNPAPFSSLAGSRPCSGNACTQSSAVLLF